MHHKKFVPMSLLGHKSRTNMITDSWTKKKHFCTSEASNILVFQTALTWFCDDTMIHNDDELICFLCKSLIQFHVFQQTWWKTPCVLKKQPFPLRQRRSRNSPRFNHVPWLTKMMPCVWPRCRWVYHTDEFVRICGFWERFPLWMRCCVWIWDWRWPVSGCWCHCCRFERVRLEMARTLCLSITPVSLLKHESGFAMVCRVST